MNIEHIAIWTKNLEEMKEFYEKIFNGKSNEKYINPQKHFESYFITFDKGPRIELMTNQTIIEERDNSFAGYAHIAFSLGSKEQVDNMAKNLRQNGYKITSGPRTTGDGYYECCFHDYDGNTVEITI